MLVASPESDKQLSAAAANTSLYNNQSPAEHLHAKRILFSGKCNDFLTIIHYDRYRHKILNVDSNIIVVNIHGSLNSAKFTLLTTSMYIDLLLHIG